MLALSPILISWRVLKTEPATKGVFSVEYTVSLLFSVGGAEVLLVKKARTIFAGMYNGVGGKVEKFDESNLLAALREIKEETGATEDDLVGFKWLGTLMLPWDCTDHNGHSVIHFYAAVVDKDLVSQQSHEVETLAWHNVQEVLDTPADRGIYAGHGDLQYFIRQALNTMSELRGAE